MARFTIPRASRAGGVGIVLEEGDVWEEREEQHGRGDPHEQAIRVGDVAVEEAIDDRSASGPTAERNTTGGSDKA